MVALKLTKRGHVVGCKCRPCLGARNRSKGQRAQKNTHRALGGTGNTPKRKKPTKLTKTKQKALADKLFSAKIRARGRCEGARIITNAGMGSVRCNGNFQCAHIVSRRYLNTRWDEDNALCMCAAHHLYATHHPLEWRRYVGEPQMTELEQRALSSAKVDYDEVLARLKEE